jgi:hypothetical protein
MLVLLLAVSLFENKRPFFDVICSDCTLSRIWNKNYKTCQNSAQPIVIYFNFFFKLYIEFQNFCMWCSRLLHSVSLVCNKNVSEELATSIFRLQHHNLNSHSRNRVKFKSQIPSWNFGIRFHNVAPTIHKRCNVLYSSLSAVYLI